MAAKTVYTNPTLYLKFKGVFDHSMLAKEIQNWFDDNAFEIHLPKYKLKATEAEYRITGKREVTEYCQFNMEAHLWCDNLKEIEIVKDGEKIKTYEGAVRIEISGVYILDYEERFKGNKFLQWLQDWYHKYVIKQQITDVYEDDLLLKQQRLLAFIKGLLGTELVA